MMKIFSCFLVLLLLVNGQAQAQKGAEEEKTLIELKQPESETKIEMESTLIGMEAFKEVIESGRYLVGPGDEFLVFETGMNAPYFSHVLAEGGIFIPTIGIVKVGGLRLREARQLVEEAFHRTVKVGELVFELKKPRLFPVPVLGMVQDPGLISVSGVERISQVIARLGSPMETASRRNIRVFKTGVLDLESRRWIRRMAEMGNFQPPEGIESQRVDLELYQVTGDSRYNPFVEDGDIIIVPMQTGKIGGLGAVQRPAFYEFVQGDRISDLLTLALGPVPSHDPDNVVLFRFSKDMITRVTIPVDFRAVLDGDPDADLLLQGDDWLNVREISGYHQRREVRIVGEVVSPGYYVVNRESTTLKEIIQQAGGFTENASLAEARMVRMQLVKEEGESGDPETERIRSIPVGDRTELDNQYFIMKTREKPGQMVVDFEELFDRGDEDQNILLMPGDVIVVPALQRTVMVSGQAAQPGAVVYDPTYSVWDYIEWAGGFGWRASEDVLVIKARTGERKRAKEVERIEPGDRIWIKEKPERDYWVIFTQAMGVIGQVSTVVLLYVSLTK